MDDRGCPRLSNVSAASGRAGVVTRRATTGIRTREGYYGDGFRGYILAHMTSSITTLCLQSIAIWPRLIYMAFRLRARVGLSAPAVSLEAELACALAKTMCMLPNVHTTS